MVTCSRMTPTHSSSELITLFPRLYFWNVLGMFSQCHSVGRKVGGMDRTSLLVLNMDSMIHA